jgi:hypothetical protein
VNFLILCPLPLAWKISPPLCKFRDSVIENTWYSFVFELWFRSHGIHIKSHSILWPEDY